jgi:diaminohydroxyphosphoribosylaminopyrimidine deaminase/5-amino-6-(5-phosphoribosylamino)uracil reductase
VSEFDEELMAKAIEVAKNGDPSPNPHVGCIVARVDTDGYSIVGKGHHEEVGRDHAEVAALREAGDKAKGSTVYVTPERSNTAGGRRPGGGALGAAGGAR